jgi:hypothetical protein
MCFIKKIEPGSRLSLQAVQSPRQGTCAWNQASSRAGRVRLGESGPTWLPGCRFWMFGWLDYELGLAAEMQETSRGLAPGKRIWNPFFAGLAGDGREWCICIRVSQMGQNLCATNQWHRVAWPQGDEQPNTAACTRKSWPPSAWLPRYSLAHLRREPNRPKSSVATRCIDDKEGAGPVVCF